MEEQVLLVSAILGLMLSLALIAQVFSRRTPNFFLGLVMLVISMELFFSWGGRSGYNNSSGAFPFQIFLSYLVFPPSIYLFTRSYLEEDFSLQKWQAWLFLPVIIEVSLHLLSFFNVIEGGLMQYPAWIWFISYLPLVGFGASLVYFWIRSLSRKHTSNSTRVNLKYFLLMGSLTIVFLQWLSMELFGWQNFYFSEIILSASLIIFAFLIFLESSDKRQSAKTRRKSTQEFTYNDEEELERFRLYIENKKPYKNADLTVALLARNLKMPARYVSYLINNYYHSNFNEFINQLRIDHFLDLMNSDGQNQKTLLAVALESGFNSKSTFNQAFKNIKGQTPSEFLKNRQVQDPDFGRSES